MTTSQETMTDAARRGQEAITSALQIWADSLQRFVPMSDTKLRGAVEAVDNMFDFYEQMLVTQREFTKSLMAATTSATTKAAYVAQDAAKDMGYAAKDVAKDMVPSRDVAPNKEVAPNEEVASRKS